MVFDSIDFEEHVQTASNSESLQLEANASSYNFEKWTYLLFQRWRGSFIQM